MEAIVTKALTKRFGEKVAVNGLELTVREGELYALLGVNGAGKTTTIRMLTCLARPTSGEAFVMGHSVSTESELVKSVIGVSPQETSVALNLTVRENLEFFAGLSLPKGERRDAVDRMIETFDLKDYVKKRAKVLSGGWQRRLSIAMAMVSEPKVLFLDEPSLGLDVLARRALCDTIAALKGRATVVLTTHNMDEVELLADRTGLMANGRLCAVGTVEELKERAGESRFEDAFVKIVGEERK